MDIGTIILTVLRAVPFILILLAIGAFTRLGKAGWRFGLALFAKKIMIVANEEDRNNIRCDLTRSGLIKEKNIRMVSSAQLVDLKGAFMIIVSYGYLKDDDFARVINEKSSRCGLIVYCPPEPERGSLSEEEKSLLNSTPFTTLCNFRGRLVNDVLLMMLSTSFKKKDWEKQKERQA